MKKINRVLILFVLFFITVLVVIYCRATHNTNYKSVHFTAEDSMKDLDSHYGKVLYEFKDEKFLLRFYEEDLLASSKKDEVFWVKDYYNGILKEDINDIRSATVGDTIYIYGVTKCKDVDQVKVLDWLLNEKTTVYNGKRIDSKKILCFCLKIPKNKIILPSVSIKFVDSRNNIVNELSEFQNDELYVLLESVLSAKDKGVFVANKQTLRPSSLNISKKISERFYLTREENNKYSFQEFSKNIELMFFDDYVLVIEEEKVTTYSKTVHISNYNISYKMNYTDDLLKLKDYALSQN